MSSIPRFNLKSIFSNVSKENKILRERRKNALLAMYLQAKFREMNKQQVPLAETWKDEVTRAFLTAIEMKVGTEFSSLVERSVFALEQDDDYVDEIMLEELLEHISDEINPPFFYGPEKRSTPFNSSWNYIDLDNDDGDKDDVSWNHLKYILVTQEGYPEILSDDDSSPNSYPSVSEYEEYVLEMTEILNKRKRKVVELVFAKNFDRLMEKEQDRHDAQFGERIVDLKDIVMDKNELKSIELTKETLKNNKIKSSKDLWEYIQGSR